MWVEKAASVEDDNSGLKDQRYSVSQKRVKSMCTLHLVIQHNTGYVDDGTAMWHINCYVGTRPPRFSFAVAVSHWEIKFTSRFGLYNRPACEYTETCTIFFYRCRTVRPTEGFRNHLLVVL